MSCLKYSTGQIKILKVSRKRLFTWKSGLSKLRNVKQRKFGVLTQLMDAGVGTGWRQRNCRWGCYVLPEKHFHNCRATKSVDQFFYWLRERRVTDSEAPKLWKGSSGSKLVKEIGWRPSSCVEKGHWIHSRNWGSKVVNAPFFKGKKVPVTSFCISTNFSIGKIQIRQRPDHSKTCFGTFPTSLIR